MLQKVYENKCSRKCTKTLPDIIFKKLLCNLLLTTFMQLFLKNHLFSKNDILTCSSYYSQLELRENYRDHE